MLYFAICRWVEHDPMEILDTVRKAMDGAIAKGKEAGLDIPGNLKGFTNHLK